jgi:S1-C subfamily serine protease
MTMYRMGPIERFESWLKPALFFLLLALLVLLNIWVWFIWNPKTVEAASSELLAGLRAERDRLQTVVDGSCNADDLRSFAQGESGPLAANSRTDQGSKNQPAGELVSLLEAASVLVFHANGIGSGFFIDSSTIVTNRHVVEGAKGDTVSVTNKAIGGALTAKIVSVTRASTIGSADFALLRVNQSHAGVRALAIASQPSALQQVVAVGFPGSGIQSDANQGPPSPIFTSGDVSVVQPQPTGVALVIHTADISPGSSGGALVDRCGGVVGVNTFVKSGDSRAEGRRLYALSADSLRKFLDSSGQSYTNASDCQAGRTR